MPDVTTIAAALTSFNTLKNIAQSMISLRDAQAFQAKILEFNGQLIDAQTKIFAVNEERSTLIERVRELESEVTRMKDWETEKKRYQLATPYAGCLVYALKKAMSNGEPPHYICTSCYEKGERSILQAAPGAMNAYFYCPNKNCQMKAYSGYPGIGSLQYAEDVTVQ